MDIEIWFNWIKAIWIEWDWPNFDKFSWISFQFSDWIETMKRLNRTNIMQVWCLLYVGSLCPPSIKIFKHKKNNFLEVTYECFCKNLIQLVTLNDNKIPKFTKLMISSEAKIFTV